MIQSKSSHENTNIESKTSSRLTMLQSKSSPKTTLTKWKSLSRHTKIWSKSSPTITEKRETKNPLSPAKKKALKTKRNATKTFDLYHFWDGKKQKVGDFRVVVRPLSWTALFSIQDTACLFGRVFNLCWSSHLSESRSSGGVRWMMRRREMSTPKVTSKASPAATLHRRHDERRH